MRIDILTLFPEMIEPVISSSIINRGRATGALNIFAHHIRDYTTDKHGRTDLPVYGGGKGMLMTPEPIYNAYNSVVMQAGSRPHVIYMSPAGKTLTQKRVMEIADMEHICILCGHYEGVDQRIIDEIVDEEISVGDYVLTGGEIPALVLVDAVGRLCPGVIEEESWQEESHSGGLLEHPHYTKPFDWLGREVPEVLVSGHHANIEKWRREESLLKTLKMRPDMLENVPLTKEDLEFLKKNGWEK